MVYLIFEIIINLFYIIFIYLKENPIYFRLILGLILSLILFFCYKIYYKRLSDKNGVEILQSYKIENDYDKYIAIFMILLYFNIFVFGFFYLRFLNKETSRNLPEIYNLINLTIKNEPVIHTIINTILLILIVWVLIELLIILKNIFKRYFVKIHLYYVLDPGKIVNGLWIRSWPDKIKGFTRRYGYNYLIMLNLCIKYPRIMKFKIFRFPLEYHLYVIIPRLHYIVMTILLSYDIFFNAGIISLFYKYMPYIFWYKLYIDFSDMFDDVNPGADIQLSLLLYDTPIKLVEKDIYFLVEDYIVNLDDIPALVHVYLPNGLNRRKLYMYKEKTRHYPGDRCYYRDWNEFNPPPN